jgi:hypothetical protein
MAEGSGERVSICWELSEEQDRPEVKYQISKGKFQKVRPERPTFLESHPGF